MESQPRAVQLPDGDLSLVAAASVGSAGTLNKAQWTHSLNDLPRSDFHLLFVSGRHATRGGAGDSARGDAGAGGRGVSEVAVAARAHAAQSSHEVGSIFANSAGAGHLGGAG